MGKISIVMILLSWWFFYYSRNTSMMVGPFKNESTCEAARKSIPNKGPYENHTVKCWGGTDESSNRL